MRRWFFFILLLPIFSQAQIFNPVKWTFSQEWKNEKTAVLNFTATIEDNWHLYAAHLESDEGPLPTVFYFEKSTDYSLNGEITESKPISKMDPIFEMEVNYHEKKATFSQEVELNKDFPINITGELEFMVCDEERCLPPELVAFSFTLEAPEEAIENGGVTKTENQFTPDEFNQVYDPVEWEFKSTVVGKNIYDIILSAKIEKGWYVYTMNLPEEQDGPFATKVNLLSEGIEDIVYPFSESTPINAYDHNFMMDLQYHKDSVQITARVKVLEKTDRLKGLLEFMVCNDERCLPPEEIEFDINLKDGGTLPADHFENSKDLSATLKIENLDLNNPENDCNVEGEITQEKKTYWNIFILGLLGGFLALLTPCVFPMIPLTVSFFTKGGKDKSGKWQSILYGVFILLIYIVLSTPFHFLDSVDPEILNTISTNVYLNMFFFVIFLVFAISFFGYFEITVPASFTNRIDSASNVGGLVGTFFMALTLALVSFSCTGPILGSLLAGSLTSDGGAMQLSAGMAGFGLALALPFALFAAFPGWMKNLPKSGGWLNTVKVVLGFVEVALAVKFLSNADLVEHWGILPREIFFAIWMLCGLGLFAYLFGWIKFPHDTKGTKISMSRRALGVLSLIFVIYLAPGLTDGPKANRELLSGFPPPLFYSLYEKETECPLGINCFKDYNTGVAYARANNKPILLDFTGWACVNCRKMEENVWPKQAVYEKLKEDFVLISLYVDDRKKLPADEQFTYTNPLGKKKKIRTIGNKWSTFQTLNFNNNSQPFYAVINADGKLMNNPVGYTPSEEDYIAFLDCGLSAFQEKYSQLGE